MTNISSTPPPEYRGQIIIPPPLLQAPPPFPPGARRPRRWVNLVLLGLTVISTIVAGTYLAHFDQDLARFWQETKYRPWVLLDGIPFSVTLLSILIAHELGHYLVSRYYRVDCSLPYFLPGPTLVGTFGAVIFMRSPIPNRKALFDIGAAGPLMGLVVAVLAAAVGLATAKPMDYIAEMDTRGMVLFAPNLLLHFLQLVIRLPGADQAGSLSPEVMPVWSSPFLDAAMVGFLVTALNLLPIGQLDGGHINYAVFGRRSIYVTGVTLAGLAVGAWFWPPWIFLAVFLLLVMGRRGFKHPPPLDLDSPLGVGRTVLAAVILLLFALIFSPVPVGVLNGGWTY